MFIIRARRGLQGWEARGEEYMPTPIFSEAVSYTAARVERRYPFVHAAVVPPVSAALRPAAGVVRVSVPVTTFCASGVVFRALAGGQD